MSWKKTTIGLVVLSLFMSAGTAIGQTITVTISNDIVDVDWMSATIDDLPGPDGEVSLSEAIIASNNTPGHQTIGFAVPEGGWLLQFLFPGRVVFTSITGFHWRITDEVTIDGTTQTASIGDTNPDGGEIVVYGDELFFLAPNCTLIGFDSTSVFLGSNSLVQGNTGNMNISVGGSGTRIEGNSGGTIAISGDDHVLVGNTVQRVRVLSGNNNTIGGPNPADRNFITGYGTWSTSSGLPSGTTLQVTGTVGTVIENNYIGTTPDGLAQGNPASTIGVSIESDNHDLVLRDNLIAGINAVGIGTWAGYHFGNAVLLWGSGDGSNIELTGNSIGLDANGDPFLGSVWGIDVGNVNGAGTFTDVRIERNAIAGHTLNGITVGRQITDARISQNSIYGNGWIGIDLIPTDFGYGVTPNDPFDADTGGNELQNYPDIDVATSNGHAIHVAGHLHSEPLTDYTLEFFASPDCNPSGFGEGQTFLGSASVVTDSAGDAEFDISLAAVVPTEWVITSTATHEPIGATSEFSECLPIQSQLFPAESFTITRGTYVSGSIVDLTDSDDSDLSARRGSSDISSRVFLEVLAISPTQSPSSFEFTLEASVFARSPVVQSIDLYNYDTDSWEEIDSRIASRFSDSTTVAAAIGNLSRFVQDGTDRIEARCRYESANPRQQFSVSVDQTVWTIVN